MTEQEELIQDIRERLGEMPKRALPFNLLAFTTTVGQRYSMTEDKIMPLVRGLRRQLPHRVELALKVKGK